MRRNLLIITRTRIHRERQFPMKKVLIIVLAIVTSLTAFGALAAQDTTTVDVTEDPVLGPILTDSEGMVLYLFTKDEEGKSNCYDQCAENWPPFTAEEPLTLPEGVEGELTLIDRDDGTQMVAYNGIPLYYWINDENPGDTTGQGVGDVWYVVAPGQMFGTPMASPVASPVASPEATPSS
jgi:predicted lipoprotein with Yx(FWY)xxD motif